MPGWSRPLPLMGVASLPKYATFGHLADVVLPRDCFMHRYDIGRATGVDVPRDPTDADVVAQVVRDLVPADGPAFVLRLSGTGGGEWQVRAGTPDDAALTARPSTRSTTSGTSRAGPSAPTCSTARPSRCAVSCETPGF
ncbi:MAG: hypothetical protein R2742_12505 [Micropruina glycogenica]